MRERSGRQAVPERSGPEGWNGVLAQRTPPIRAAAKRRRGLGQAGLTDGRERRSLRSPSGRLTAQRRDQDSVGSETERASLLKVVRGRAVWGRSE
jgi:hypothetical protein